MLFEREEIRSPLPKNGDRARHLIEILRLGEGSKFDAGIIDGDIGKAEITRIDDDTIEVEFVPDCAPSPLFPLDVIVGLPRPQTARDILRDATAMGVRSLLFAQTDKGEKSYSESKLWKVEAFREYLIQGAQTAFSTRLPRVSMFSDVKSALDDLPESPGFLTALDNYESTIALGRFIDQERKRSSGTIAIGSERGWSQAERDLFRNAGFTLTGLGERVLRSETAVIAAIAIAISGMKLI